MTAAPKHAPACQCETCSPSGVEWATPDALWDLLAELYPFALDAAATCENAKVEPFLTKEDNGLVRDWADIVGADGAVWCNPPYGRGIGAWVKKGRETGRKVPVVMLLPVKADTAWWHDYVVGEIAGAVEGYPFRLGPYTGPLFGWKAADGVRVSVWYLRGRLSFGEAAGPGRFASAVVSFEPLGAP